MNASLYVHVPFCEGKCDYCDFFSVKPEDQGVIPAYVDALGRELDGRTRAHQVDRWDTAYVGGGTPSLLEPDCVRRLGALIPRAAGERTIEANPEDLTEEWLVACADAGFNRLSLGIQSMRTPILAAVGRRGSRESNLCALELVSRRWHGRLSVDVIAGLPGTDTSALLSDLGEVVGFGPDHVSLYSLTVEEGTPLAEKLFGGTIAGVSDEDATSQWISGRDFLEANGFPQYEVSNFAKPGFESSHNLVYWNLGSWVGIGPGATGTIARGPASLRYTNGTDIRAWIKAPLGTETAEEISATDTMKEAILMGFRLVRGLDTRAFRVRFGVDARSVIGVTVDRWRSRGLLDFSDERIWLTRDGLLVLNRFLVDCLEELCEK